MPRKAIILVGVGALMVLAFLVWPTPYRYLYLNEGGDVSPVRVHRITGRTEVLDSSSGWYEAEESDAEAEYSYSNLPTEIISKLNASSRMGRKDSSLTGSYFKAILRNTTEWYIYKIDVRIEVHGPDKEVKRNRKLTIFAGSEPGEVDTVIENFNYTLVEGDRWDWAIVGGTGRKPVED